MTLASFGSICETVPSRLFATQADPAPTVTALGPLPTSIYGSTVPVRGRFWSTLLPLPLVTQTKPPPTATPSARADRNRPGRRRPSPGRSASTVRSREFATQTNPPPQGDPGRRLPTLIVATTVPLFALGSIFETVPSRLFATQTNPPPPQRRRPAADLDRLDDRGRLRVDRETL